MKRTATAVWNGSGKEGKGQLTTPSGVLSKTPYSFHTRFEDGAGTNPEELIAAAHAGCFNMALAFMLSGEGLTPEQLNTTANLTMLQQDGGWTITSVHLDVQASIPGVDAVKFSEIAQKAKAGCPVSRVLNAEITMKATLVEESGK
jgi:osmotically inducible protein OsmC